MIKISILSVLLPHLVHTIFIVRSTTETIQERNTNNNDECGITSYYTDSTNSLIPNGEYALPGQWPWVVALNLNNRFRCTGSLLTNKHILTAATCLEFDDSIKVALGQFKLRDRKVVGTVNRQVARYMYMHSQLAILILRRPVEFSPFIRPICLWSNSTDLEKVDRTGYVVGWASNNHVLVSEPRMLRIPIVSQETCFWNDGLNRTSCADLTGGNVPCYADLGSGLVLFNNSTGRYHLRGVLLKFINRLFFDSCNGSSVYVDVAKYLPWIQQQISIT